MDFFLDEQPIDTTDMTGDTLEQLLRVVQDECCTPGQLVVGIRCDGQDVESEAMGAALAKAPSAYERVDIFTSHKESLVVEALTQAATSLEETTRQVEKVAGLLTEGREKEGAEILAGCIAVWQQVHMAIDQSVRMLELDPAELVVNDEPLLKLLAKPAEVLGQIKEALQSQDFVMLSDVLQYEFGDACEQWLDLITRLRSEAERLSEATP